jgi:ubiquinone/menaquinone biosynthesis C-methylase UbiE
MLADEYYDPVRHPTCANFRDASEQFIGSRLGDMLSTDPVCEVGCGMSIIAEMYWNRNLPLRNLYLTDSSSRMLEYSSKWRSAGAHLLLADAAELPFASKSIAICIASLGDPYNRPKFWDELARIMLPGGYAVFTTPSFEWAREYRLSNKDGSTEDTAEFRLADGKKILTPSIVCTPDDQVSMIEKANDLQVADIASIVYSQLRSMTISPKLLMAKDRDQPVVTGYLIRKHT